MIGYHDNEGDSGEKPRPVLLHRLEAELLVRELDTVLRDRSRIIEVVGDPGTGKTRLLAGLAKTAYGRGLPTLLGRCAETERGAPFQVFTTALGTSGGQWPEEAGPENIQQLLRAKIAVEAHDGLLLVLDDFHWADAASVGFLDHLTRWPIQIPLLVVVAHRPKQTPRRLRDTLAHGVELGVVRQVQLGPLTLDDAAEFLGLPQSDVRVARLHHESDGNPLYLQLLGHVLADSGTVPRHVDDVSLDRLHNRILGERAPLSAVDNLVFDAAVVLGEPIDIEVLAMVADLSIADTMTAVERLLARDLVRRHNGRPRFRLRHPVFADVLRRAIEPRRRVRLHHRALEALAAGGATPRQLATHIEQIGGLAATHVHTLIQAAEDVLSCAPGAAVRWAKLALRAVPESADEQRDTLRLLLSQALGASGQLAECRDVLRDALRNMPASSPKRSTAVAFCAQIEFLLGEQPEAVERVHNDLGTPPSAIPAVDFALDLVRITDDDRKIPRPRTPKRKLQHHDSLAETADQVLTALRELHTRDLDVAPQVLTRSARVLDLLPEQRLGERPEVLTVTVWAELLLGRYADARRHLQWALSLVNVRGQHYLRPLLQCFASQIYRRVGTLPDARLAAAEAAVVATEIGARRLRCHALALESLSIVWSSLPGSIEAISLAEMAITDLPRGAGPLWSGNGALALATAAWLDGDPQQALHLVCGLPGGQELTFLPPAMRPLWYETAAAASADADEEVAGWAEAAARTAITTPGEAFAVAADGHNARQHRRFRMAAMLYHSAADRFRDLGYKVEQARMLVLAAGCSARDDRVGDAAEALAVARTLARSTGAARVHREALDLERQCAVRIEDCAPAKLGELTDREREVAYLAATGRRTRDIADHLSLSPRTVEVHLTRIYRKLNVTSRAALVRLIAKDDERCFI